MIRLWCTGKFSNRDSKSWYRLLCTVLPWRTKWPLVVGNEGIYPNHHRQNPRVNLANGLKQQPMLWHRHSETITCPAWDPAIRDTLRGIFDGGVKALHLKIGKLREENQRQGAEILNLKTELSHSYNAYNCVSEDLAELQQYTRRNALRITNPAWPEDPNEDTDKLVISLANALGVDIQPFEISRSHRVGKPRAGYQRPILVKFIGYRTRERLFKARQKLKEKQEFRKVYINEDLTKATSELAFKARQLRRAGKLAETFTLDGKVFVKKFITASLTLVKNDGHLRQVADLSPYSEIAVRPLFNGPHLSQQTPGDLPSETRPQVNATSDPPQVTDATGHEGQSDMDINISSTPHESPRSHPSPNKCVWDGRCKFAKFPRQWVISPWLNLLCLSEAFWWCKTELTLALVMVCCPTAPNYYPNQRWSIMCKIHCHSSDSSFTGDTTVLNHQN